MQLRYLELNRPAVALLFVITLLRKNVYGGRVVRCERVNMKRKRIHYCSTSMQYLLYVDHGSRFINGLNPAYEVDL